MDYNSTVDSYSHITMSDFQQKINDSVTQWNISSLFNIVANKIVMIHYAVSSALLAGKHPVCL